MSAISKILVPVDFSSCSDLALRYALDLARSFSASVDLLHVWETPLYIEPHLMVDVPGEPARSLADYARNHALEQMQRVMDDLVDADLRERVQPLVETGHPYQAILAKTQQGYDLVVMGTHGRTGFSHAVLGSIAEKIVRNAPCPVLTVRCGGK